MTRDTYVRLGRGVFRLPCNKSTESSDDPGVSSPDDVSTTVATVPVDVSPTFTEYVPSWDTKGACLVHGAVCVHGGDDLLCTLHTGSSSNSPGDCDCDCDCDSDCDSDNLSTNVIYVSSWDTKGACLVHGAVCVHGGDDLCTLQTGSSSNSGGDCDCDCDCDSDSGSGCANVRGKSGCTKFSYTLCVCVCFCVRGWVRVH